MKDKRTIEDSVPLSSTANKRQRQYADDDDIERLGSALGNHREIRYDFTKADEREIKSASPSSALAPLATIKQQLNEVKALLSDKDISQWNRLACCTEKNPYAFPFSLSLKAHGVHERCFDHCSLRTRSARCGTGDTGLDKDDRNPSKFRTDQQREQCAMVDSASLRSTWRLHCCTQSFSGHAEYVSTGGVL